MRANQPAWEAMGNRARSKWLFKLRDWLIDHQDQIADTMQAETGKVRAEASGEVAYLADLINFYAKQAPKIIGDQTVPAHSPLMKAKKLKVTYRPSPSSASSAPGTSR